MRRIVRACSVAAVAVSSVAAYNLFGNDGAAGVEQKANAGMAAAQDRSFSSEAEALYVEKCSMCHRAFGMGTVLLRQRVDKGKEELEARRDLTAAYVVVAARQGVGNMPRIPRGEVSDKELEQIARYLAGDPK